MSNKPSVLLVTSPQDWVSHPHPLLVKGCQMQALIKFSIPFFRKQSLKRLDRKHLNQGTVQLTHDWESGWSSALCCYCHTATEAVALSISLCEGLGGGIQKDTTCLKVILQGPLLFSLFLGCQSPALTHAQLPLQHIFIFLDFEKLKERGQLQFKYTGGWHL